jgi:hypothetical protein
MHAVILGQTCVSRVTYVPERLLPMSPVHTRQSVDLLKPNLRDGEGWTLTIHRLPSVVLGEMMID